MKGLVPQNTEPAYGNARAAIFVNTGAQYKQSKAIVGALTDPMLWMLPDR
jgi:hypothetical protein